MYYDQQPVNFSKDEAQIILAWLCFFWLLIPYHAVVGLIKSLIGAWPDEY